MSTRTANPNETSATTNPAPRAERPLTVAINALSAKTGGGVTYLNRLIFHLGQRFPDDRIYVFVTRENRDRVLSAPADHTYPVEVRLGGLPQRLVYEQLGLPGALRRLGAEVLFAPAEIAPLLAPCPVVLALQNPNPYYQTDVRRPLYQRVRNRALKSLAWVSVRRAARVIFVSDTSRRDISRVLGIAPGKTRAIHHGVELERFGAGAVSQASPAVTQLVGGSEYILSVSNLDPHKNFPTLLRAYAELDPSLRSRYRLLIVGTGTPAQLNYLQDLAGALDLLDRVVFAGYLDYQDLAAVYRGAALFVLPSYLETFGLTLVEAMASGAPVLAANASAIPEILGDAGELFDPHQPSDLRRKLEQILTREDFRQTLIRQGLDRASQFSWDSAARALRQQFQEVVEHDKLARQ